MAIRSHQLSEDFETFKNEAKQKEEVHRQAIQKYKEKKSNALSRNETLNSEMAEVVARIELVENEFQSYKAQASSKDQDQIEIIDKLRIENVELSKIKETLEKEKILVDQLLNQAKNRAEAVQKEAMEQSAQQLAVIESLKSEGVTYAQAMSDLKSKLLAKEGQVDAVSKRLLVCEKSQKQLRSTVKKQKKTLGHLFHPTSSGFAEYQDAESPRSYDADQFDFDTFDRYDWRRYQHLE
jgi:chromosome segregation ATPase